MKISFINDSCLVNKLFWTAVSWCIFDRELSYLNKLVTLKTATPIWAKLLKAIIIVTGGYEEDKTNGYRYNNHLLSIIRYDSQSNYFFFNETSEQNFQRVKKDFPYWQRLSFQHIDVDDKNVNGPALHSAAKANDIVCFGQGIEHLSHMGVPASDIRHCQYSIKKKRRP